jgi:mono/diheme cytochrome c family protein
MTSNRIGLGLLAAGLVGAAVWWASQGTREGATTTAVAPNTAAPGEEMVAVALPDLAGDAAVGQAVFAARCAACHGPNAGGVDGAGPPLVHVYYEPNHHGDAAFFLAAERGVRAHHWRFGDMPPVEGVTRAEIAAAIAFVRRVQRENGIF